MTKSNIKLSEVDVRNTISGLLSLTPALTLLFSLQAKTTRLPTSERLFAVPKIISRGNRLRLLNSQISSSKVSIPSIRIDFRVKPSVELGQRELATIRGGYVISGQAVANCINDVYTNHGWLSVWAWVQSAFIPETVAAFAVACAAQQL